MGCKRPLSVNYLIITGLALLCWFIPLSSAQALPACKQIFTDPVTGLHPNALTPPRDLRSAGNISCHMLSSCPDSFPDEFEPGDYRFGNGHFSGISAVEAEDRSVRLYFDNLYLDATWFNVDYGFGDAANLVIYVSGNLTMRHGSKIHGVVYVGGSADIDVTSEITGALSAGGAMAPWWIDRVDVDLDDVANADFGPLCPSVVKTGLPLQFGQANQQAVSFDRPFPPGTKPLVFLMPRITASNPGRSAPASAFLTSVDRYGFSYRSETAPGSSGAANVTPVDWIAVLPGKHWLKTSTGKRLIVAGREEIDTVNRGGKRGYFESLDLEPGLTTVLTQLQTSNNNCWLTSVGLRPSAYSDELWLAMESSGAVRGNRCYPGGVNLNHLQDEDMAWLAMAPGKGVIDTPDGEVRFQAGSGINVSGHNASLSRQCGYYSPLASDWFSSAPVLVAGLESRNDNDGGWLRMCGIEADEVSMVVDETANQDRHDNQENFGFLALEKPTEPDMTCLPIDTFSRDTLGSNWVSAKLPGSASPGINNGRLVITRKLGDQAASLTYRYLFPADANAIRVSFDYYAWHQSAGRGGDGVAVVFSDANQSPSPGGFGGAMGYAQRMRDGKQFPGFHGGWLGIALDSWGNFSSSEGGKVGGAGSRPDTVAMRGAFNTGYAYLGGAPGNSQSTAKLNPPLEQASSSYPGPGDHYSFLLDTRSADNSYVSVDRVLAGNGRQQRIVNNMDITQTLSGQRQRPNNFYISLTGSTGQAFNEHAIDNFQVCALKSQPVEEEVHHFEFDYSGSPLACAPLAVTVRACANEDCSELYTDEVRADLLPRNSGSVSWLNANQQLLGTNTVNIQGGERRLFLKQTSAAPEDVVTLDVGNSSPATMPYSQTLCFNGGTRASCSMNFAEAGFVLDEVATYAGRPATMRLQAVRKSDSSLMCQPAFANQSKDLYLSVEHHQPRLPVDPSGDGLKIRQPGGKTVTLPKVSQAPLLTPVKFDRQGIAHLELTYPDAGWLNLNVSYQGKGDDTGLVMRSTNGNLRSVPAGLCLTPPAGAVCRLGNPADCKPFVRAGEGFQLTMSAHAWQSDSDNKYCDNPVTPSFAMPDIKLGSELVAPVGGETGKTGMTVQDINLGGVARFEQSTDEVGVFKFSASNPENKQGQPIYYLDAGLPVGQAQTPAIGRFVPAAFRIGDAVVAPGCNTGFSYMGQPFGLGFTATALNLEYHQTFNYRGQYAKGVAALQAENSDDGISLSHRLSPLPPLVWQQGKAVVAPTQTVSFSRPPAPGVDGPYEQLAVGIAIDDRDGNMAVMAGADMSSNIQGDCHTLGCGAVVLGTQKMRFGRMHMENVYGPENADLAMPVLAEFWDGKHWQLNKLDQCTSPLSVSLPSSAQFRPELKFGQRVSRSLPQGQVHTSNGRLKLIWHNHFAPKAPQESRFYRGEVSASLAVPDWLKFYWGWQKSDALQATDPRGSAFFGRYRGDDKVIYWHEVK
ncbi:hypothetical protein L2750_00420 [Shewanella submarina]|uniref:DUF6701 domain-containing protein n=1 Tax=Shewanella submarina TaxID=2016376 RepID=A0ABV7GHL6_9GAMM|nr:DUF6701 domain-containing protein [Shewanella submarina]MCL1035622.1 hypothetical protein [Shewanella submarina]